MRIFKRILAIALLVLGLAACGKSGSADKSAVLATVNGTPVTSDMLRAFIRERTGGQEPQLTDEQRKNVLNTVVDMEVLSQEAEKSGLADKPDTAAELRMSRDGLLAQSLMRGYFAAHPLTDEQIKAAYQEQIKGIDTRQYKARHILVQSQAQAADLIRQLGKGAKFEALAQKYSIDVDSGKNGGELGDWFSAQSMVPQFSAALIALKKGEITKQPVQTQYGWHVIQLEDVRDQPAPDLDPQMRERLSNELQGKVAQAYINQLRGGAKIEMHDAAPAAASKAPAPAKP
jgi:peptidyl-prolyl cis-trans isomerase C